MASTLRNYLLATVCLFSFAAWASDSECDAVEGNMIWNCGWEGNCWGGWHPSAPIVDIGRDGTAHSGDFYGVIQAHSGIEGASREELNTEIGRSYSVSFWVRNTEPIEELQVSWYSLESGQVVLDLTNLPAQDWTQFVISDLVADTDDMRVFFGFANSSGEVDIDDVVILPQE